MQDAVALWGRFVEKHVGHLGMTVDYDFLMGSELVLRCRECEVHRRVAVYLDDAAKDTMRRQVIVH